jgi:hypothetical protein
MSVRGLQTLLIIAVTDRGRTEALLQGRATAYEGFDLSAGEIQDLMRIQAASLTDFARQAHQLLYCEDLSEEEQTPAVHQPAAVPRRSCA